MDSEKNVLSEKSIPSNITVLFVPHRANSLADTKNIVAVPITIVFQLKKSICVEGKRRE